MAFSTIFIIVIIGYVFLYGGMIVYDLCFKKDPAEFLPKQEDEDIVISDEVGQFKPILIEKDPKPDGKRNEQPLTAEKVEDDTGSNGGTTETIPPVNSETANDEPTNRKSLNDVEPKAANKEEREKISELVKQVRKDMEGEDEEEGSVAETENSNKKNDVVINPKVEVKTEGTSEPPKSNASPKGTANGTSSSSSSSGTTSSPTNSGTSSSPRKSNVARKPDSTKKIVRPWEKEAKRTGPIPVYEWKARINPDNQKTKVCGGETAESFSKKLNSYSIQELRAMCAKNNDHWDALEKARQPTEDDLEIIRMAESGTRKKPPSFTRSKA